MRRGGYGYKVVFGLQLPQLDSIASMTDRSAALAEELWADAATRESLLLAPMLYPPGEFTRAEALRWAGETPTTEVADILCLRLLRRLSYAGSLAAELACSRSEMVRYVGLRLAMNLFPGFASEAAELARAETERDCDLTRGVCLQILQRAGETGLR